ncbi:complement C1q tumor necrosis factor-related protein 7-like [Crassostrea angulata]|uniref:complement C1q tumor necrosis factor-related protein 7-like n=1 Tax=Magallana angulata TaxID=2784310 RepID=UPI0022B151FB|nr:complement C1q tumor necrosis factor-related protein 7-like [Crassostrea angulata]
MFWVFVVLMITIQCGLCDKVSPKPGLKLFREDYKSVEETCLAVGFVRNNCTEPNYRMVAFDVRLKENKRNLADKARVVFETVDLNEGLGYNASTGIFTASSNGIYVFDWTTLAWTGQCAFTSLVVNNQLKSWIYCCGGQIYLPCSKMTIVKLQKEDKVWIGVYQGPANIHRHYTSFSGYKL